MRTATARHPRWIGLLAAVLALLIVGDVALDAQCDRISPAPWTKATTTISAMPQADPCCSTRPHVPDCFCCSRADGETPTLPLPEPTPVSLAADIPGRGEPGVHYLPYHPPLFLS